MSLIELLYIGNSAGSNGRRGLRLPLLLGRLHLGLIFSGPSSSSSTKKSSFENSCLRSFLFIASILVTKCGSVIPIHLSDKNVNSSESLVTASSSQSSSSVSQDMSHVSNAILLSHYLRQLNENDDHQEYPMRHILTLQAKEQGRHVIGVNQNDNQEESVKTVGYVLKGMILPLLIALTLSFGFIIYKNRVKRARLQAIQNSLEATRLNPNQLTYHPPIISGGGAVGGGGDLHTRGFVSNALLSVLEARGEWSLISGGDGNMLMFERDDYVGEGGETARFKPYMHDKPPDYASVFDPPTYEQATCTPNSSGVKKFPVPTISVVDSSTISSIGSESEQLLPSMFSRTFSLEADWDIDEDELEDESESEGKYLVQVTSSTSG